LYTFDPLSVSRRIAAVVWGVDDAGSFSYGARARSSHHRAGAEEQTTNQTPIEFPPLGITANDLLFVICSVEVDIYVEKRHVSYLNLW